MIHIDDFNFLEGVGMDLEIIANLESSIKLKKLGFTKPTFWYWLNNEIPFVEKGLKRVKITDKKLNHNKHDEVISAPTKEQVLEWIVKNRKFMFVVKFSKDNIDLPQKRFIKKISLCHSFPEQNDKNRNSKDRYILEERSPPYYIDISRGEIYKTWAESWYCTLSLEDAMIFYEKQLERIMVQFNNNIL